MHADAFNQHLRNASNMTLVVLTLWLDGVEDGRAALFDEADISDSANASYSFMAGHSEAYIF